MQREKAMPQRPRRRPATAAGEPGNPRAVDGSLADSMEIREGLERYFYAVDAGRYALFRRVFAEDAKADYAGGKLKLKGARGIADAMRSIIRGMPKVSSNHFITGTDIVVRGDTATSDTFGAIFTHTQPKGQAPVLTAMGVRYRDRWVRTVKGWRITYRRHDRLWTCEGIPAGVAAKAVPARR
jgi:hypothetical protein